MNYERITCEDVEVGDRIARTRTETFHEVIEIREGEKSRRLCFTRPAPGARRDWGVNIRPRRDAKLWREEDDPTPPRELDVDYITRS